MPKSKNNKVRKSQKRRALKSSPRPGYFHLEVWVEGTGWLRMWPQPRMCIDGFTYPNEPDPNKFQKKLAKDRRALMSRGLTYYGVRQFKNILFKAGTYKERPSGSLYWSGGDGVTGRFRYVDAHAEEQDPESFNILLPHQKEVA